jgi:hypothetical protein
VNRRFFLLFFFLIPFFAYSQIISVSGGVDHSFFDKSASDASPAVEDLIFTKAAFKGFFGRVFDYSISYEIDPLMDYMINLGLGFTFRAFNIDVGFFFESPAPEFSRMDRGLVIGFGFTAPDVAFASLKYSSSIGAFTEIAGNRTIAMMDVEAGFWLYNIIASARAEFRTISIIETNTMFKDFTRNKIFGRLDIYGKNAPFTIRIDSGVITGRAIYENIILSTTKSDFSAVFGGMRLGFNFGRNLYWYVEGETMVLLNDETPLPLEGFLFRAATGFVITISS